MTIAETLHRLSDGLRAAAAAIDRDDEEEAAEILHETAIAIRKAVEHA